jgi:hypothetical protein
MYYDDIIIESKESYTKQTFRNRCQIKTANKVEDLIVPIRKGNSNIPIQEIRIDYNQSWVKNHWGAIQSAYGKAPYFEHYAATAEQILLKKPKFLFDLNLQILEFFLSTFGINKNIIFSQKFEKIYPVKITDLRSTIHPKQVLKNLSFYHPVEYIQVFGNQFIKDLSILDVLFCEGPNAPKIIKESVGLL